MEARVALPRGGIETQRRLLDAAAAEIASVGYERATLASIARRAGLTTGAVYSTFGSKWELLRAVLTERTHALSLDGGEALPETLADAVRHDAARQTVILQLESLLLALRHPELLEDVVASAEASRSQLAREIKARVDKPALPPKQLATLLSAAVLGLQLTQLFHPRAVSPSLYRAAIERLLA